MTRLSRSTIATIETAADIERGVRALRRACSDMRRVHELTGSPPLRREPAGFDGLARIVVAQQVSAASARAIWERTQGTLGRVNAGSVARADDETLRACGLSAGKIRTLRAVSQAVIEGGLDFKRLDSAPDEDIHAALTAIKGIGPWSADIYLMFCLGRADAWAGGDLALQMAIVRLKRLTERPTAEETVQIAERWRPWRGVAARMLWSFHAVPERPLVKTTRPTKNFKNPAG